MLRRAAKDVAATRQPTPQEICAWTLLFAVLESGASREEAGVDLRKAKATDKKTKRRKAKNVGVQVSVSGKESASDKRRYASQIQRRREREAVKTI